MKKLLLSVCCLCAVLTVTAQKMDWYSHWMGNMTASQIKAGRLAVDSEGNIYAVAAFGGDGVNVEGTSLVSRQATSLGDGVLIKMTPDKQVAWTKTFSKSGQSAITDIIIDYQDNVIVTGTFTGTISPGGTDLVLDAGENEDLTMNGFVVRFDKGGNLLNQWNIPAKSITSLRVSVDGDNNIYLGGTYGSYIKPGDTGLGTDGQDNQYFVAKYNPAGQLLWSDYSENADRAQGGIIVDNAIIEVDMNGDIYFAGSFRGQYNFAGAEFINTHKDRGDMFLSKYNASGEEVWTKHVSGSSWEIVVDIALSPLGEVALAGNFASNQIKVTGVEEPFVDIRSNLAASQKHHLVVNTFTKEGDFRWQYRHGAYNQAGTGCDEMSVNSLHCTDEGVYYVTGVTGGRAADISSTTITSGITLADGQHFSHNSNAGGVDGYFLILSPDGKLCNYGRPGGTQTEKIFDMAISPDKKSMYILIDLATRNQNDQVPVDNFFESYTDIRGASKTGDFTMIPLFPEGSYVANFNSVCLVRASFAEVEPYQLPDYATDIPYSTVLSIKDPTGTPTFSALELPEELTLENNELKGTFTGADEYRVSILASDNTGQYAYFIQYPEDNDNTTRGNNRNIRNFLLQSGVINSGTETEPVIEGNWKAESFSSLSLPYEDMTNIDFSKVKSFSSLPEMTGINPNCLVYVSGEQAIEGINVVSFTEETGTAKNIELVAGHDFNNIKQFTAESVSYKMQVAESDKWMAVCLPFEAVKGEMQLKEFTEVITTGEGENTSYIVRFVETDSWAANTPYMLDITTLTGEVSIAGLAAGGKVNVPVSTLIPVVKDDFTFTGNYTLQEGNTTSAYYLLNNDGKTFAKNTLGADVAPFNAYITTTIEGYDKPVTIIFDDDNPPVSVPEYAENALRYASRDGILYIYASEAQEVNIYSADGRLVMNRSLQAGNNQIRNLQKGIYIVNKTKVSIY